ncbi:dihydrodipicolinate synthase family protein [Nocardioides bruguierae]|uniref:Dihydrodipicolinate synthase family protein n=1 Tax=Nocardioides bruguierae TaxID=2945102 RepID=A0A9X2IIF5_9ACTN|nr:dihydrodipicolinate synthase family protein [Nocardioides bruguierae]MCM0622765.1 dihydrodipicolinate synthase family protein [Nocardioides bruguierae]
MSTVRLPDGRLHTPGAAGTWSVSATPATSRRAFAAAHVVPQVDSETVPGAPAVLDWEATLAFRRHLWSHGLGVAEAMDTAQRGMGLDWPAVQELVRRSAAEAASVGGAICAGVGTDQLERPTSLEEVLAGYEEQLAVVEDAGAQPVLMASRHLAALAEGPEDYAKVYGRLLGQVSRPVVLHWLGSMFDPALEGYWGSRGRAAATDTFVELVTEHADKVDGVKVSLLDRAHEEELRRRLPAQVRVYTGDDFHYDQLVLGDGAHHSDALLGAFAAVTGPAAAALRCLDTGDVDGYRALMEPTVDLSRHLFATPTWFYKAGVSFLSWLGGHQPGYTMIGGLHSGRSAVHLATAYRMADDLGLFADPELAAGRMRSYLEVAGVAQ